MKTKIGLAALMLSGAGSACADWTLLGRMGDTDFYYDPASVERAGNEVKLWSLYDLNDAQSAGFGSHASGKRRYEIDCTQDSYRRTVFILHAGRMGTGKVIDAAETPEIRWIPIIPDTIVDSYSNAFCS